MGVLKRLTNIQIIAVLAALVFLIFGNTLFHQFVWDDGFLIVSNPYIKNLRFIPRLFSGDLVASTTAQYVPSGYYRPLSMLSFMADYHIWKLNPFGYHLTNVLIHWFNVILVFFIIFKISQDKALSFLTAMLFGVHPIHSEAVAPIYNRMGIQVAFFMLLAFYFFLSSNNLRTKRFLVFSLISFSAGLLSKENAIVLPLILMCYDFIGWSEGNLKRLFQQRKILFYLSCFVICAIYLLMRKENVVYRFLFPIAPGLLGQTLALNVFFHFLTVIKILGLSLFKVILPVNLSPLYWVSPVNKLVDIQLLVSLCAILCLLWLAFVDRGKKRAFFILFFFLSIAPFSNILPISEVYTFRERFLYLPSLSICFFSAAGVVFLWNNSARWKNFRLLIYTAPYMLLFVLGIATVTVNYMWRNNATLWTAAVKADPLSQLAHLNLAESYMTAGKFDEAIKEIHKSLSSPRPKAQSSIYLARLNLATIYLDTNHLEAAGKQLEETMLLSKKINLNPYAVYDKLGLFYAKKKNFDKAEEYFKMAVSFNEYFIPSLYNLAVLYYEKGDWKSSREYARRVLRLDKDVLHAKYLLDLINHVQRERVY